MISKDQIQEFSKRLAIDEFTIIREYIQIVFLSILYSTKESQKIYFKGGTAIRLLLKSGRFSEDLDFTAELTTKEIDEVVNETIKKVSLTVPDVRLKKTDEGKASYTGILSYQPEGMKYPLNIHLDFSLREKPETSKQTVLETDFPVAPQPVVRHMDWQEILAEKIRAFLVRSKGRDVYDLWFMLGKWQIDAKNPKSPRLIFPEELKREAGEIRSAFKAKPGVAVQRQLLAQKVNLEERALAIFWSQVVDTFPALRKSQ